MRISSSCLSCMVVWLSFSTRSRIGMLLVVSGAPHFCSRCHRCVNLNGLFDFCYLGLFFMANYPGVPLILPATHQSLILQRNKVTPPTVSKNQKYWWWQQTKIPKVWQLSIYQYYELKKKLQRMNECCLTTHRILLGSWRVTWHWQIIKLMRYGNECQWNEMKFRWNEICMKITTIKLSLLQNISKNEKG